MISRALVDLALDLLAPTGCVACDERVSPWAVFCSACAPSVVQAPDEDGEHLAAFVYGGAPATALARLKYAGRPDLAARLARGLVRVARGLAGRVDVVVPVPIHPRRLAARGYNQAALLAGPVARCLRVSHEARGLVRVRDTPRQATLDRTERTSNVRHAFACRRDVRGLSVVLVDDVRTTGATLEACTVALREAGVRRVYTLVVARHDREGLRCAHEAEIPGSRSRTS